MNGSRLAEAIIDGSSDAIFVKDLEGRYVLVNQAGADFIGLPKEQILGRCDKHWFVGDSVDTLVRRDQRIMREGKWETREETLTSNGTRVYSASKGPLRDASGAIVGLIGISRDITQQKRTEERLKRSNEDLERFAYVASHDLQEPLRMVSTYLGLLERKEGTTLSPRSLEMLHWAREGATRMSELISGILSHSRIANREMPLGGCEMEAVVDEAMRNLQTAIDDSEARLYVAPLPTVQCDRLQLVQLLQNLLANAIKYRSERPPEVHVGAERDGDAWCFYVKDNGVGIPDGAQDRIFGMFERAHGRREFSGSGIGLTTCQRIVERHGGRIWAERRASGGSVFYFTLPAIVSESTEQQFVG